MRIGNSRFYDDKNYPYGFSRSGKFTIREAKLLEDYGRTMMSLTEGKLTPESDVEQRFLSELTGKSEPTLDYSKCWLKYLNDTGSKKRILTLSDTSKNHDADYEVE